MSLIDNLEADGFDLKTLLDPRPPKRWLGLCRFVMRVDIARAFVLSFQR